MKNIVREVNLGRDATVTMFFIVAEETIGRHEEEESCARDEAGKVGRMWSEEAIKVKNIVREVSSCR
ncbi:hypothetical protein [Paenibacillus hexagrammi]|uniref:Uncharacterized protein n=1 Tax=Paenibacillus hexagrammi TaxID=2908839 RepID=A0ABY3SRG1_9BACL|nr:hypothetical protein [Paenibacillus sp. YPD9-1]UJF35581.1 hypothetical protein L0M14_11060 [Paenibacillus sp. YPD9-1]